MKASWQSLVMEAGSVSKVLTGIYAGRLERDCDRRYLDTKQKWQGRFQETEKATSMRKAQKQKILGLIDSIHQMHEKRKGRS